MTPHRSPIDPIVSRHPAVVPCLSFGLGIALDYYALVPLRFWSVLLAVGLMGMLVTSVLSRGRLDTEKHFRMAFLLCFLVAAGGLRHDVFWDWRPDDHVSRLVGDEPVPVKLTGHVLRQPVIHTAPESIFPLEWQMGDFTTAQVECQLWNEKERVSGTVELRVSGHWVEANAGDCIEILGKAARPRVPQNPGEFDLRLWQRRRGIDVVVRVAHPKQIATIEQPSSSWISPFPRIQNRLKQILDSHLSPDKASIAAALLLGVRSDLDPELKENFVRSGTFHLLAISGLHVGMIAVLLGGLLRVAGFSSRTTALGLIAFLIFYAFVTELRPSVFRATLLISLYLIGHQSRRITNHINLLFATALVLLVLNPAELFSAGAQLSFLAVLGIVFVSPCVKAIVESKSLLERASQGLSVPWHRRFGWFLKRHLLRGAMMGVGVWLLTFPVTVNQFHLFPIWGIPLTLLLIPVIAFAVSVGLMLLLVAIAAPPLTWILSETLAASIEVCEIVIEFSTHLPGVSHAVATPQAGWYVAYLCAIGWLWRKQHRVRFRHWLPWIACLLFAVFSHGSDLKRDELRVTFLSVGHGLSVLIETGAGETILYDAGSSDGGSRAGRILAGIISDRGLRKIDCLILSHADLDHYSAIPELLGRIPIEELVTSHATMRSRETNVVRLQRIVDVSGVPVRLVVAGDEIRSAPFRIRILHPRANEHYETDNASSVVLLLEYAGRTIVLTGDVEDDGLTDLIERPIGRVDVLQSPHHGSLRANSRDLAEWANSKLVVVSAGKRINLAALREIFGADMDVISTNRAGAVTVKIDGDGKLTWEVFRVGAEIR